LTGKENLYMHANLYGVPPNEQRSRIEKVLNLVELEDRANDILRTYSSGMRRRLEIARGLIHYPKVLFLDEPTLGLDPQTRDHIWKYIRELKEAHDITVVVTTHYMEEADYLSGRVAIIDRGRIVAMGTPAALKDIRELRGRLQEGGAADPLALRFLDAFEFQVSHIEPASPLEP
jgi:ABC-2 type transport system ATP-binding protein